MRLYRLLLTLAAPLFMLWAVVRVIKGTETRRDLSERLGLGPIPKTKTKTLWVHAASNGELASVAPILHALVRSHANLHLRITTNSTTGRALATSWSNPRISAQLAPFDTRWAAKRLTRRAGITGLIVVEADVWPNRITTAQSQGLPVILLGARLSAKSAKGWRKMMWLVRPLTQSLTWAVPQDNGTARRLKRLGLQPEKIGPTCMLKALYSAEDAPKAPPPTGFDRAQTWLAASTHPGEDEIILAAHALARKSRPDLRLILAPRHVTRTDEIESLAHAAGFTTNRVSICEDLSTADVTLLDTMGEMARFYPAAMVCCVAGSFENKGGHTPFEPIAHGAAILNGPHVANFKAAYTQLDAVGGALQATHASDLAEALLTALDPKMAAQMNKAAQAVVTSLAPANDLHQALQAKLGLTQL